MIDAYVVYCSIVHITADAVGICGVSYVGIIINTDVCGSVGVGICADVAGVGDIIVCGAGVYGCVGVVFGGIVVAGVTGYYRVCVAGISCVDIPDVSAFSYTMVLCIRTHIYTHAYARAYAHTRIRQQHTQHGHHK